MAKKSKRRSRARATAKQVQSAAVSRPVVAAERPAAGVASARPVTAAPERAPAVHATDLAQEYRYVVGDLKRIGILAASMLALLVVLALLAQNVF